MDGPRCGQARRFSELDDALVDRYIVFRLAERQDMANVRALLAAGTPTEELSRRDQRLAARYGRSSKGLSNTSINATLASLRAMIEFGRRRCRGVLEDNPAADKSVPDANPDRSFLEVHAFAAILDAAADLDERRVRFRIGRLPAVATLGLAGPRVGELSALRLRRRPAERAPLAMNGETTRYTMGQIGHRSAALTLELYEQISAFRRAPDARLRQWLGSAGQYEALRRDQDDLGRVLRSLGSGD